MQPGVGLDDQPIDRSIPYAGTWKRVAAAPLRNCSTTAPCWRPSLRHLGTDILPTCTLLAAASIRADSRRKGGRAEGAHRHTWRPPGPPPAGGGGAGERLRAAGERWDRGETGG